MIVNHQSIAQLEKAWAAFDRPINGTRYRHYKGGEYEVVTTGFLEETEEPCVIYRSLKNNSIWVRTAQNFLEGIEHNGHVLPRFQKI
jgi:hypothetical protein